MLRPPFSAQNHCPARTTHPDCRRDRKKNRCDDPSRSTVASSVRLLPLTGWPRAPMAGLKETVSRGDRKESLEVVGSGLTSAAQRAPRSAGERKPSWLSSKSNRKKMSRSAVADHWGKTVDRTAGGHAIYRQFSFVPDRAFCRRGRFSSGQIHDIDIAVIRRIGAKGSKGDQFLVSTPGWMGWRPEKSIDWFYRWFRSRTRFRRDLYGWRQRQFFLPSGDTEGYAS